MECPEQGNPERQKIISSGWGREGVVNDSSWVSGCLFRGRGNCLKLGSDDDGMTLNVLRNHCRAHFKKFEFYGQGYLRKAVIHTHDTQNPVSRRPVLGRMPAQLVWLLVGIYLRVSVTTGWGSLWQTTFQFIRDMQVSTSNRFSRCGWKLSASYTKAK